MHGCLLEYVGLATLGLFLKTEKAIQSIVVMMDLYTKLKKAIQTPKIDAIAVTCICLEHCVPSFGTT